MRHQLLPRPAGRPIRPNPVLYLTMLGPLNADDWREARLANTTLRQIEVCGLLVADQLDQITRTRSRQSLAQLHELLESKLFGRLKSLLINLMDVRFRPLRRLQDDELLFFSLRLDRSLCGAPRPYSERM